MILRNELRKCQITNGQLISFYLFYFFNMKPVFSVGDIVLRWPPLPLAKNTKNVNEYTHTVCF